MPKMSTDLVRHKLNGAVMGTRWSAVFYATEGMEVAPVQAALTAVLAEIDAQMSTWKPQSDLMRLNAAEVGIWVAVPDALIEVLRLGLAIGQASGGAFDIGLGDAVQAWGFGPAAPDRSAILSAMAKPRRPTLEVLQLDVDACRVLKTAAITLDLNGIAKGYAVDRMTEVLAGFGIGSALAGLDGELRATGLQPDGRAWSVAVERPDYAVRAGQSVIELHDAAVATSGDYRHWVDVGGKRLSHTMDRVRGAPLDGGPASVTVMAQSCAEADGWATALMVLGGDEGPRVAAQFGLSALFLTREGAGFHQTGVGRFADKAV